MLASLRFGHAIIGLDGADPCKQLFFAQRNDIATKCRNASLQTGIHLDSPVIKQCGSATMLKIEHNAWLLNDSGPNTLKGVKLVAGTSSYLLADSRITQTIRARLRHDRASLAASLHQRRIPGYDTPLCATCNTIESVEHCLLYCTRLSAERRMLHAKLQNLRIPLNLATVLICDTTIPREMLPTILRLTAEFLQAAHLNRKL